MKIRTGFISNSSSCSFIVCKSFLQTEKRVQQIIDWYEKKSKDTYMDDMGAWIKNDKNYITGGIAYVVNDFLELMKEMCISENEFILMEDWKSKACRV